MPLSFVYSVLSLKKSIFKLSCHLFIYFCVCIFWILCPVEKGLPWFQGNPNILKSIWTSFCLQYEVGLWRYFQMKSQLYHHLLLINYHFLNEYKCHLCLILSSSCRPGASSSWSLYFIPLIYLLVTVLRPFFIEVALVNFNTYWEFLSNTNQFQRNLTRILIKTAMHGNIILGKIYIAMTVSLPIQELGVACHMCRSYFVSFSKISHFFYLGSLTFCYV